MSLPSKACNILHGRNSFISINATAVNPITVPSAPWHSSGYGSSAPAGRPTSPTMNRSIFRPLRERILLFLRLDGTPQTLEGTDAQRWAQAVEAADGTLARRTS